MSFEFVTVASDLETYLRGLVPTKWRVVDGNRTWTTPSTMVLAYVQGNAFSALGSGARLPAGQIGVEFDLLLSAPGTDAAKSWPRLSAEVPSTLR